MYVELDTFLYLNLPFASLKNHESMKGLWPKESKKERKVSFSDNVKQANNSGKRWYSVPDIQDSKRELNFPWERTIWITDKFTVVIHIILNHCLYYQL